MRRCPALCWLEAGHHRRQAGAACLDGRCCAEVPSSAPPPPPPPLLPQSLKRKGCGPGSSSERTRTAITGALKKKLKDLMGEFQDLRWVPSPPLGWAGQAPTDVLGLAACAAAVPPKLLRRQLAAASSCPRC